MKVTKFTGYNPAAVDAILSVSSTTFVSAASNALDSSAIGGVTPVNSAQSNWHLVAYSSNFAEWRPDGGGSASVSFGSNSTDVGGLTLPGGGSDSARSTHYHAGIFSVTASSSNTLQRPVVNLRPGTNIVFGLTDTDGSGDLDTLTINSNATAASIGATVVQGRGVWGLPILHDPGGAPGTAETLATSGGSLAVPLIVAATMLFDEVNLRELSTSANLRTAEYALYLDDDTTSAKRVTGTDGTFSTTPAGSPQNLSSTNMSGSPVTLSPGVYVLVIRNTSATQTFIVGYSNVASTFWNTLGAAWTKAGVSALGASVDFSSGWSPSPRSYGLRIVGRNFGNSL